MWFKRFNFSILGQNLTFYIQFDASRLDLQNGIRFLGSKTSQTVNCISIHIQYLFLLGQNFYSN
jgi:hypothetical protein